MQLVMVGNQHQRSYGKKTMKAHNTINLGQISGEMKTLNTFILRSKGLKLIVKGTRHKQNSLSGNTLFNYMPTYTRSQKKS